jgi:phospholipase D1/2
MTLVFPDHELYSTLLNEHNGDFRNSDAKSVPPEQGPREPWHDIHSKVEGPIAGDVFKNFYERWQKQVRLICFSL